MKRTLAVLFIPLALVACGSSKKTSSASATTTTAAKSSGYKIGDTAKSGDFSFKAFGLTDPQPPQNDFSKPKAGAHWVSVDVETTNTSSKQQLFSGLAGFHLLDSQHHQYDEALGAGIKPGAAEGEMGAGQAIRGLVVFEVPDGTTGLKLRVQGGLTAAGAVFTLS